MPFVLTGTIVPNAVPTAHGNAQRRHDEYVQAIRHYLDFGPVYFIENSGYPVLGEPFFVDTPGLTTFAYPRSASTARGKGYQEFEMLDDFVRDRLREDAFVKVTGRYVYKNIGALTAWMRKRLPESGIVIDMKRRERQAIVGLFAVSKAFYVRHLQGAYRDMDDSARFWAEYVLYRRIRQAGTAVFLQPAPVLRAVTASMGMAVDMRDDGIRQGLRTLKRRLFWLVGMRELLF